MIKGETNAICKCLNFKFCQNFTQRLQRANENLQVWRENLMCCNFFLDIQYALWYHVIYHSRMEKYMDMMWLPNNRGGG